MRSDVFKIINVSLGIVVFAVCALLAREYILWKYRPLAQEERSIGAAAKTAESASNLARYRSIGNGLFGKADINLITTETAGQGAPSAGDIALMGTVVGRSGMSYAIFQGTQSKKQEISRPGDRVFDLGVLRSIEANRVTIDSNGRMLTFYLPQEKPPGAGSAQAGPASPPSGRFSGVSQKTGSEWVIDQRALNNVLNNMGKVLTDARLLPYSDNGKIAGFRISEIKSDGVFNLIGLKNGDVLVKVNDYSIDSPEKGVQLLTGLRGESRISLDIIRNGQPAKLNYQIR